MELLIKANNADELSQKIVDLANKLGPKQMKVSIQMPAAKVNEAQQESIFNEDEAPAPTVQAGKKGKKAAALPPQESEDVGFGADSETETDETTDDGANDNATTEISRDDAADMLRAVIAKAGANAARDLMGKLGYSHLAKVPDADLGKFMKACEVTIDKAAKAKANKKK